MEKLRIDSNIKKIEVNDDGEYIVIPMSDTAFFERFGNLVRYFDKKQADIETQMKALAEKHKSAGNDGGTAPGESTEATIEVIEVYSSFCKDICAELDKLFGEGCCRKVFVGVESPGIELIADFFEQITPLLQKYAKERGEKINTKYNRGRKGAKS